MQRNNLIPMRCSLLPMQHSHRLCMQYSLNKHMLQSSRHTLQFSLNSLQFSLCKNKLHSLLPVSNQNNKQMKWHPKKYMNLKKTKQAVA